MNHNTTNCNYEAPAATLAESARQYKVLALKRFQVETEYTEPLVADLRKTLLSTLDKDIKDVLNRAEDAAALLTERIAVPF